MKWFTRLKGLTDCPTSTMKRAGRQQSHVYGPTRLNLGSAARHASGLVRARFVIISVVALLMLCCVPRADALTYWYNLPGLSMKNSQGRVLVGLGIMGYKDGLPFYCVEAGIDFLAGSGDDGWKPATGEKYRIAAELVTEHKDNHDDLIQAAVAWAIHDHLEENSLWSSIKKETMMGGYTTQQVADTARKLWNEAAKHTVSSAAVRLVDSNVLHGTIVVELRSADGPVEGVNWHLEYDDSLIDVQGPTHGKTGKETIRIPWTARSAGKADVKVVYDVVEGQRKENVAGKQNLFMPTGYQHKSQGIQFDVDNRFQPLITSDAADHRIEPGQLPHDRITWSVDLRAPRPSWPENAPVRAQAQVWFSKTEPKEGKKPEDARLLTQVESISDRAQTQTVELSKLSSQWLADHPGATPRNIGDSGWLVWQWSITRKQQVPEVAKQLRDEYWTDGVQPGETVDARLRAMKPVIHSSVRQAQQLASDGEENSDEENGTKENGVEENSDAENSFEEDPVLDAIMRDREESIRDTVTLDVEDINGDGVVDTHDWLHTRTGWGEKAETEGNQITLVVKGELLGGLATDQMASLLQNPSAKLPEGVTRLATTEFSTNHAGTFLISSSDEDEKRVASWHPEPGVVLDELESGYQFFRFWVDTQASGIAQQTGLEPTAVYPFVQGDVAEDYGAADETVHTRSHVTLLTEADRDTLVIPASENAEQQVGTFTVTDRLELKGAAEADTWPVDASGKPVAVSLQGTLYKVDGELPSVSDEVPDSAQIVSVRDVTVSGFSSKDAELEVSLVPGNYTWMWKVKELPSAFAQNSFAHQFAQPAESFQVTREKLPQTGATSWSLLVLVAAAVSLMLVAALLLLISHYSCYSMRRAQPLHRK